MRLSLILGTLWLTFVQSEANPAVLKEAEMYEAICTATLINLGDQRVFAIDCIIKGNISQKAFMKTNLQASLKYFKIGDRCVFMISKDGKEYRTSPLQINGNFSLSIDDKLQTYNINNLIKIYEPKN